MGNTTLLQWRYNLQVNLEAREQRHRQHLCTRYLVYCVWCTTYIDSLYIIRDTFFILFFIISCDEFWVMSLSHVSVSLTSFFISLFLYRTFHYCFLPFPHAPWLPLSPSLHFLSHTYTHTHTLKHTHAYKHTAGLSEWAPVTLWINHSKRFLNNAATSPDARCVYVCVCVCVCVCVWRWSHIYCSCSHSNSVYDLPKVSIKIKEHRLCRTHSHTCLYPMTCMFRWTGWCWLWGRSFIITQQEDRLINTHAHAHSRLFNQSQTVHQSGVF